MTELKLKPRRALKELEITEVSSVDSGANEGAKVTLWKRDISKALPDPSNALGIQLLRVLARRVENVRLGSDINRLEAWVQVLGSEEGQQLLALVSKGDQSIFEGVEKQDAEELADFLETADGGAFLKVFSKELKGVRVQKEMAVVEKILKKDFRSQIEATNSLKLELVKRAPADDRRSPEKRLVDFLDSHPDVEDAIRELPNIVKVEEIQKRDFGPTWDKISKLADELLAEGKVTSKAKGVTQVIDRNPTLLVEYYKEQV